jgi:hypothetical protein
MKGLFPMSQIMLIPTPTGGETTYEPANQNANRLRNLLGRAIADKDLPLIEAMGFTISFPNGQPIAFPKDAYKFKSHPYPKHIRDEA